MILIKLAKNKNKTIKEAYGKYYARPVVSVSAFIPCIIQKKTVTAD